MLFKIAFTSLLLMAFSLGLNAQTALYKVNKIKKRHGYYLIYVMKGDSTYKIISKKEFNAGCLWVRKGGSYPFILSRVKSFGGPEVECFSFDERTVFCRDADTELAVVKNLKGLCLVSD